MSKFYKILLGGSLNGKWTTPIFPLNEENMQANLENGTAFEIEEEDAHFAPWGSGTWVLKDDGTYENIAWHFDSSD